MNVQNPSGEPPAGEPTAGQPAGPVTPPGAEPTSQGEQVTIEGLSSRLDQLEKSFGKRQSAKDKGVEDAKKDAAQAKSEVQEMRDILDRFQELTAGGMSREDAEFRMRTEAFMSQLSPEGGIGQPSGPAPQQEAPSVDPQAVLTAVGLEATDPEVTAILGKGGDPTPALIELSNKRKMPANPANVMPTGSGPAPKGDLWDQYQKEVAPLRANKNSFAIAQVQAKYRKLGLQV
jgi:hypothetical protein